ncbi:hypothetical protein EVG20_g4107 [Dentipellis fragilis]|uniref:Uncharacterized protein n=1 Tax=Dentipellis fragilis TaxID=205917 RepID=A0A4Y9YZE1_9AGAM|nr:hypothetical protein EVG20_g4107 [Dentipellis fragilis]
MAPASSTHILSCYLFRASDRPPRRCCFTPATTAPAQVTAGQDAKHITLDTLLFSLLPSPTAVHTRAYVFTCVPVHRHACGPTQSAPAPVHSVRRAASRFSLFLLGRTLATAPVTQASSPVPHARTSGGSGTRHRLREADATRGGRKRDLTGSDGGQELDEAMPEARR